MASKNLTEGQKTKLTSLFKALDANGDGFLDIVRGEKNMEKEKGARLTCDRSTHTFWPSSTISPFIAPANNVSLFASP